MGIERRTRKRTGGLMDRIFDRVTEVMEKYKEKKDAKTSPETDKPKTDGSEEAKKSEGQ